MRMNVKVPDVTTVEILRVHLSAVVKKVTIFQKLRQPATVRVNMFYK